jgi:diguanylate cyclase (GGDEF)-like protein
MNDLNEALGRDIGITVAALDYLSNIESIIHNPKIIEEGRSNYIVSTTLIDNLTNLFIRNVFDVVLEKEFNMSQRDKFPLSLLMIDIDDFKAINDTYGHTQGDEVLRKIGQIINNSVRSMDLATRYGGEELSVIMPYTDTIRAYRIGDRIRKRISNFNFGEFNVTVSIGVSSITDEINTAQLLIKSADNALYQAKRHGKNIVKIYTGDES